MEATEQEIYDQAIVEQTQNTPETPTEAPEEAKEARTRDEKGRFVSATTGAPAEVVQSETAQPEAEKPEEARVPSWRLAEEAERRRSAEQALADMRAEMRQWQMQMMHQPQPQQPPQEAPDIFADPQGFISNLQSSFDQRIKTVQLENSLRFAHYAHGDQFNEAYRAFTDHVTSNRDQATYQRVMASPDPGEALVQWWKEGQLHKELGGSDLKSFLEKQKEEWLKDPSVQAKVIEAFKATQQASAPSNLTSLPPSLSRAAAARSAHDDGGSSGADMYAFATSKR